VNNVCDFKYKKSELNMVACINIFGNRRNVHEKSELGMDRGFVRLRTLFYLFYAVVLTAALLYLRFPTEKVRAFCENKVESLLVDSDCNIERLAYRPPFSVVFVNLQIVREIDGKRSAFRVDRLALSPNISNLFRTFQISGELYKGNFSMQLAVDTSEKSFALSEVSIAGMNIDEWASDFNLLDRKISGKANVSGDYRATFAAPLAGAGKGELSATDGSIELLQPILSLKSLSFDRITIDMTQEKEMLKFVKGEMTGKEIGAEFTGEMRLASPLPNSIVILGGHLTPKENFLATHPGEKRLVEQLLRRYKTPALPFKVGGTVRSPTFRFSL